jgi:4-hydroxythreonine-4-phosphate dehydrogenase
LAPKSFSKPYKKNVHGIPAFLWLSGIWQFWKWSKKLGFVVDLKSLDPLREDIIGGPSVIPVWDIGKVTDSKVLEIGKVTAFSGDIAVECVSKCVELGLRKRVSGIATAPINKEALKKAGHRYIGHTEMLSEMSGSKESAIMFLVDALKNFFTAGTHP